MAQPEVKMIALLKKKSTLSIADAEDHYETIHVPLIFKLFGPYMARYARNYVNKESTEQPGVRPTSYDIVTEVWFATKEDFAKFNEIASRPDVRKLVEEDEEKFLDASDVQMFLAREFEGGSRGKAL